MLCPATGSSSGTYVFIPFKYFNLMQCVFHKRIRHNSILIWILTHLFDAINILQLHNHRPKNSKWRWSTQLFLHSWPSPSWSPPTATKTPAKPWVRSSLNVRQQDQSAVVSAASSRVASHPLWRPEQLATTSRCALTMPRQLAKIETRI